MGSSAGRRSMNAGENNPLAGGSTLCLPDLLITSSFVFFVLVCLTFCSGFFVSIQSCVISVLLLSFIVRMQELVLIFLTFGTTFVNIYMNITEICRCYRSILLALPLLFVLVCMQTMHVLYHCIFISVVLSVKVKIVSGYDI